MSVDVEWRREAVGPSPAPKMVRQRVKPIVVITSTDGVGKLRIGIWDDGVRLVGWFLPFVPSNSVVTIDSLARRVYVAAGGAEREVTHGYVRGWDGGPVGYASIPRTAYTLTVDQEEGRHVPIRVEVLVSQTRGR